MIKLFRALAVIAVCGVILYIAHIYQNKTALQKEIDLSRTTIVTQLVKMSNVETAKMSMQKIIAGKKAFEDLLPGNTVDNAIQNFLFEDSLQLVAYADITAWFNLNNISTGAVSVNENKEITLILPQAQILHASLTPETKPFTRKRGILSAGDVQLETDVRNKALEKMTAEAIQNWLIQRAQENAKDAFSKLFAPMWYTLKDVQFSTGNIQL